MLFTKLVIIGKNYYTKYLLKTLKLKKEFIFIKLLEKKHSGNRKSIEYGRYSFYADRYDYVRIANMMMNHWKNDLRW